MQRRRYGVLFLSITLLMAVLTGCGAGGTENGSAESIESAPEQRTQPELQLESQPAAQLKAGEREVESAQSAEQTAGEETPLETENEAETENVLEVETQAMTQMQMVSLEVENASNFAMELPGFMDRNEASLDADPKLEELLIRHYGLTEEISRQTRYYYDRIDLNGDGRDEIFAILVGPKTTSRAGSMGSLILQEEDGLKVEKDFSQLYMPIVVSTNIRENWHDLILCVGEEDGTEHYVVLNYNEGAYAIGGQMLESLEGIDGAAYLCNDLNEDQETGRYLMLAQGASTEMPKTAGLQPKSAGVSY